MSALAELHDLQFTTKELVTPYAIARFFQYVAVPHKGEDKCWIWTGGLRTKGYGGFMVAPGKNMPAHRFSLLAFGGGVEPDQLACHRCDNPPCVNPKHLFAGTPLENSHDRDRKGRHVALVGEDHGQAKLDKGEVRAIRALAAEGMKQRDIAALYSVTQTQVWRIIHNKSWRAA